MPSEFGGSYNDLMEHWRNDLKDLAKVVNLLTSKSFWIDSMNIDDIVKVVIDDINLANHTVKVINW